MVNEAVQDHQRLLIPWKPCTHEPGFWHSCDPGRGAESTRHRSLGAYLHLSSLPSVFSSPDRRATVTSKSICKLSGRNNILPSIEDEWPTFLVRYSRLILPHSPLTVALTDYTWQRLDEGRWWLGACLRWTNKHLNGCSWLHSSRFFSFKKPLQKSSEKS